MDNMGQLMAAFGKVIITPEEITPIQGYDPRKYIADPATDKMDDLYARIALLDDGAQRVVLISLDCSITNEAPFLATDPGGNGGPDRYSMNTLPPGTRKLWADAALVGESHVSAMATHTHSGPEHVSETYTLRVADKIHQLTRELQPVTMKIASGNCAVSANRRPHLQPNFHLPVDQSLHVVMFYGEGGNKLGALVNYAVHPTVLVHPANRISGDIIGVAMRGIENALGNGLVCLFVQGFAGDVCPAAHDRTVREDTYPLVLSIGRELCGDTIVVMERLRDAASCPIVVRETVVGLPTHANHFKPFNDVVIQGVRIGDVAMVCVSAEPFNGFVGQLRNSHSFGLLLCAGVANGYAGYLPTAEAYEDGLGGYEMNTTTFDKSAVKPFVAAATGMLESLKGE